MQIHVDSFIPLYMWSMLLELFLTQHEKKRVKTPPSKCFYKDNTRKIIALQLIAHFFSRHCACGFAHITLLNSHCNSVI